MKKAIRIVCIVLAAVILLAVCYAAYLFLAYHRIGDQPLAVQHAAPAGELQPGTAYRILSYNIGFGAYESDYGFFMDGGTESWAWSKERLDANLKSIAGFLSEQNADLTIVQEVDFDATRTYHFDEREYLRSALSSQDSVFAQNFDSPFLCYPFTQPHGFARAGLMSFSAFPMEDAAQRIELPVENGAMKILDLDRCYCKCRIPAGAGELVLYNFHLSAYTSDGSIATEQLKLLLEDMEKEYAAGSFCIAAGDFNKDLLGDSSVYFGKADKEYTWAQPFPSELLDGVPVRLIAPLDEQAPVPSCRNADGPYHDGQFVLTIDGFLVSDNVSVVSSEVIDTGFAWSDHNPVAMRFVLAP